MEELKNMLVGMNIPEARKNDLPWLLRNLGIQNGAHPNFPNAMKIIKEKLIKQT